MDPKKNTEQPVVPEVMVKMTSVEGYIVAFPEQKTTKKQPNPPTWNRKE